MWIMGLKGLNQFSSAVLSHSRVGTTIGFSMEFGESFWIIIRFWDTAHLTLP